MRAEFFSCQRRGARGLQRKHRANSPCGAHATRDIRFDAHPLSRASANPQVHHYPSAWLEIPRERLLQAFVQRGIIGLPDAVAWSQFAKVDVPVLKIQTPAFDFEDPPALLGVGIAAGIEDYAVPRLQ